MNQSTQYYGGVNRLQFFSCGNNLVHGKRDAFRRLERKIPLGFWKDFRTWFEEVKCKGVFFYSRWVWVELRPY
jgi:hypothetical protein